MGSRCDLRKPRGLISPIEPRLHMGIPYGDLRTEEEAYLARRTLKGDVGLLVRTVLASALAPSEQTAAVNRPFLVSAQVDNLTIKEALNVILARPHPDRARMLYFVHAHALNLARFNRDYAQVLAGADALLPDGIGIRLAARMLGIRMRENVNGTDLFPILCSEAASKRIPLVLIGGAPGIAAECARRMQAENPGLEIPIISPGFFADDAAIKHVVDQVAKLPHSIVLVGMGSPRQEQWAWRHLRGIAGATVLTVGGLFDFYSGRIRRAPIFWRETGMEWAYRLLQEPRRLAKRYLVGNPLFLALAVEQRLRGRRTDSGDHPGGIAPVAG